MGPCGRGHHHNRDHRDRRSLSDKRVHEVLLEAVELTKFADGPFGGHRLTGAGR